MATLGIDIGCISVKMALVGKPEEIDVFAELARAGGGLEPLFAQANGLVGAAPASSAPPILATRYLRIKGSPAETALGLLSKLLQIVPEGLIAGIRMTGTGSRVLAERLGATFENEFKAIARAVGALHPDVNYVFEMGGETSKFIHLEIDDSTGRVGIVDYQTNGDCAAGTGSFMDQQANRLLYDIEDVGDIVLGAGKAATIAGRCSVFAKSDMIHSQQKGYQPPEVLKGLCNAVVRNFRGTIARGKTVDGKVAFIGGVAANGGAALAMRETFGLSEHDFMIPRFYAWMGAIGAALLQQDEASGHETAVIDLNPALATQTASFSSSAPLSMEKVILLRDRVKPYVWPDGPGLEVAVDAYLGIDVGSVSTNLVVLDAEGELIKEIYTKTDGRPVEVVNKALQGIWEEMGPRLRLLGVGTTGSGRELIGELVGADTVTDEITAHKTGATFIGRRLLAGRIPDTIFEIGGQDSKYISLEDGIVVDFAMNQACAAGTGSFLEEQAEKLGINIIGEFAEMALSSNAPVRLGERCTVFMERDVNSYLQRGAEKTDLVAGLAFSIVHNYLNRLVAGRKIGDTVYFQGGTAYNDSVAAAFSMVLDKEIIVPPHNGVLGAVGMALLAKEKVEATGAPTTFRGWDLEKVDYTVREFTCRGCSNECDIRQFTIEGEKTYWGDKCSDRYRKRAKVDKEPVIPDLLALRERLLLSYVTDAVTVHHMADAEEASEAAAAGAEAGETDQKPPAAGAGAREAHSDADAAPATHAATASAIDTSGPVSSGADAPRGIVGIPRAMYTYDRLPFWATFFKECGFDVLVSGETDRHIRESGIESTVAEPCFPIRAAHGHALDLFNRGVDYVFIPNLLNEETDTPDIESHCCAWGQTLPYVMLAAPALEPYRDRVLNPTLHFRRGPAFIKEALADLVKPLGVRKRQAHEAAEKAYAAQSEFRAALLQAGADALATLAEHDELGIVLVGRPYNIYDPGVNMDIPNKLRKYYGVNAIPIDFLPLWSVETKDITPNMFWNYGRKILQAARFGARNPNLHVIYLTNFKCGPDSYIKQYLRATDVGPLLTLQFDEHTNDAGAMTRCEAYLDSKGFLRWWTRDRHELERQAGGGRN